MLTLSSISGILLLAFLLKLLPVNILVSYTFKRRCEFFSKYDEASSRNCAINIARKVMLIAMVGLLPVVQAASPNTGNARTKPVDLTPILMLVLDSDSSEVQLPPPTVTPITLSRSSYKNFKGIGLETQTLPGGDNTTRAYGNFTGSGRPDLFRAVITYDVRLPAWQATPSRFEFFAKQASGEYVLNTTIMPQTNGCLHPRKAIVADFNNDRKPDVFVACHGYDAPPFPGETNKVVLSQPNGTYAVSDASSDIGFHHAATAADSNGDGAIDVVVVNNFDLARAYVLLNNGTGHFVRESVSQTPASIRGGTFFSVELVDVNEDGMLDLLFGGHEFENAATSLFLNTGSNDFTAVQPIVLPPVPNEGVVLDFTVTGTGATRAIWVVRTSGGDGTFYQSRVLQRVTYPGLTSTVVLNQRPAVWVPWVVPISVSGLKLIASDNASDALSVSQ